MNIGIAIYSTYGMNSDEANDVSGSIVSSYAVISILHSIAVLAIIISIVVIAYFAAGSNNPIMMGSAPSNSSGAEGFAGDGRGGYSRASKSGFISPNHAGCACGGNCQCNRCVMGMPCKPGKCRDGCTCDGCGAVKRVARREQMAEARLVHQPKHLADGTESYYNPPWLASIPKRMPMYDYTKRLNTDHLTGNEPPRELCIAYTQDAYSNDCV